MTYKVKAAILAVILVFLVPSIVSADEYIDDAALVLQRAPVYVAPGTEGTDSGTAARLQARLTKDDNIVLVMLPANAETLLKSDLRSIAIRLSEKLENKRIIGLAVGGNVVAYAPTLPTDVAEDKMRRAQSVTQDPYTALTTFAQNMHSWLKDNPQPKPDSFGADQQGNGESSSLLIVAAVVAVFVVAIFAIAIRIATSGKSEEAEKTSFDAPHEVNPLLKELLKKRPDVRDTDVKAALYQICEDMDEYFKSSSSDRRKDAVIFARSLGKVVKVLNKYVEIQQKSRYFWYPDEALAQGKSTILGYSEYVLRAIKDGNAVDLFDYDVNTRILDTKTKDLG